MLVFSHVAIDMLMLPLWLILLAFQLRNVSLPAQRRHERQAH